MDDFDLSMPVVVRVAMPDAPVFQLRKGEDGLSVFDPVGVDPPLTEAEILDSFREGSVLVIRSVAVVEAAGLRIELVEGAGSLPERLRKAHCELRPGPGMSRPAFKQALKGLE
jgi:hypothetical protein